MGFNSGFKGLIPADRGFLVEVIRIGLLGICSSWVCCPLRFVLDCCSTVLCSPDLSDCLLVISVFVLFTSYLQTTVLVFFNFCAASFTEVCISRCVLDMFIQGPAEIPDSFAKQL